VKLNFIADAVCAAFNLGLSLMKKPRSTIVFATNFPYSFGSFK